MLRFALLLITTLVAAPLFAAGYADNPAAQAVIAELVEEEGFDAESLNAILADAERQESILKAIARPAEKTKPWYDYRKIFVTEKRENQGVEFYNEHREALLRAETELGVPAEIIVAIIGVETYYGRITGSYHVLDALSTLAFDYPKRSPFFTSELKHFLILTRDQNVDPRDPKGSYAGAMGYGQFMPSSYRHYAIDFDGDGKTDIWNNPVDAIGSVANYFKAHGWRTGQPVVSAAVLAEGVDLEVFESGLKPELTLAQLKDKGVTAYRNLPEDTPVTPLAFEGAAGWEYWLGLHNFYVITRYNHSAMYAMSVYQLSQNLARRFAQ